VERTVGKRIAAPEDTRARRDNDVLAGVPVPPTQTSTSVARIDATSGFSPRCSRHALAVRREGAISWVTPLPSLQTIPVLRGRGRDVQSADGDKEKQADSETHVTLLIGPAAVVVS
jgi:hypothetical protein